MYELGLDDEQSRRHLWTQLEIVDHIDEVAASISRPPEMGSVVAALDELIVDAPVSVSQSLHTGLITAKDCLMQIATLVRNEYYMLAALQSLTRTALMGAARAAFVLAPDEPAERERAARIVVQQEAQSLMRALNAVADLEHLPGIIPPEEFRTDMKRRAAALEKMGRHGEGNTMSEMSQTLATSLSAHGYQDSSPEVLAEAVTWIWHSSSGTAHAYGWPRLAGGEFVADFGVVVAVANLAFDAAAGKWFTE